MSNPICQVVNGSKSFGAVQALADLDLSIFEGELLGIVGPNGSGKTTLFNCISGQLHLTSGQVYWRGRDITKLPMHTIARLGVVRTFQQAMYFSSGTVRENVEMACEIAHFAGITRSQSLPTGADELVEFTRLEDLADMPASSLSHGSLRRLGIALTLAANPALLLLDEPAAGLNDAETADLSRLLRAVRDAGVTLAVVDHDMSFVMPLVDRVVVLAVGKKLTEGPPAAIRANPEVIEVFLGTSFAANQESAVRSDTEGAVNG